MIDYGQTLGRWGVGPGCYLVLPIFGPSTARDAAGTLANFVGGDPWFNVTVVNDTTYFNEADYYVIFSNALFSMVLGIIVWIFANDMLLAGMGALVIIIMAFVDKMNFYFNHA